MMSSNMKT